MKKHNGSVSEEFRHMLRRMHVAPSLEGHLIEFVCERKECGRVVLKGDGRTFRELKWREFVIHYSVNWATGDFVLLGLNPDPGPKPGASFIAMAGRVFKSVGVVAGVLQAIVRFIRERLGLTRSPVQSVFDRQLGQLPVGGVVVVDHGLPTTISTEQVVIEEVPRIRFRSLLENCNLLPILWEEHGGETQALSKLLRQFSRLINRRIGFKGEELAYIPAAFIYSGS
jgi:hypothetical protein